MEEVHGDYKTVAHIDPDRTVTFYDAGLPEEIREEIQKIAATSEMSISATQDAPVFSTPPKEPERVQDVEQTVEPEQVQEPEPETAGTPTGQWLPPLTCTGKLRSLYPSQRMLSTSCTCPAPTEAEHRPCRTLYSRHRLIPFTIPENGSVKIPAVLQIPCRKLLQKKSQFTIYFH